MQYLQTEFTKDLENVFKKHKKCFEIDKYGIHIIDSERGCEFIIARGESGSESSKDRLIMN